MLYIFLIINIIISQNLSNFDISSLNKKSYNKILDKENKDLILDQTIKDGLYIVGPGDEFYLSLSADDFSFNNYLVVSPVGDLVIPSIGLINLDKLLLKDAYDLIKSRCSAKYSSVNIDITLTDVRKFYIKVHGLTYGPSKVLVTPLHNISDAFEIITNKINKNKLNKLSMRNVELRRNDDILIVDLLKYKIFGNSYNTRLLEGDIIYLNEYDEYIDIYGGVKNVGRYEFVENEKLNEIIDIAGGFSFYPNKLNVEISRFSDNYEEFKVLINDFETLKQTLLYPYDHIIVSNTSVINKRNLVYIDGEVQTPGFYVIENNMTFSDLLYKAGGYTVNADTNKLIINNSSLENDDYELTRIKLIDPQKRTMSEISYLKSRSIVEKGAIVSNDDKLTEHILNYSININDRVKIPIFINYIEVIGAVNNPGRYPYFNEYNISDYVNEAGGKSKRAKNSIYIINSLNQKTRVSKNSTSIKNGEIIFVESKEDYNLWNKLQESMGLIGQLATLIAVIQSAQNN